MSKLLTLKQRMAAAHPDRGGTCEAFVEAHRRYIQARNEAELEAWFRKNQSDAAERAANQQAEWEQYLAKVAMTGREREAALHYTHSVRAREQRCEEVAVFVTKALKHRRHLLKKQIYILESMKRYDAGWSLDSQTWTMKQWQKVTRIWRCVRTADPDLRARNSFEARLDNIGLSTPRFYSRRF